MSSKRGGTGKKEEKVNEKIEAEAQALIEKQDTTDVDGAFLRGLLVNLADEEEVELAPLLEKRQKYNDAIDTTNNEILEIWNNRGNQTKEQLQVKMKPKKDLLEKLNEGRDILVKEIDETQIRHKIKQREIFYISPENKIEIKLNVAPSLKSHMESHITPQKEFLESIWNLKGGQKEYEIKVEKQSSGGGASWTGQKKVTMGTSRMYETTPLHEFAHQVEEQTHGARAKRALRTREIILKMTGKKKLEEVELEKHIWYIDSSGKEHYHKVRGENIYVPKGIFKTKEEQSKYGYGFRVYEQDVQGWGKKKHIKPNVSERFGIELVSTGTEHIYNEPKKFAERFPEVFDMVVDLYRGKL